MSRGPGRVERAIEAAFQQRPDDVWTVEELTHEIYPETAEPTWYLDHSKGVQWRDGVEKKHRVSIIRAAKKVCGRTSWAVRSRTGGNVYFNRRSVWSSALSCRYRPTRPDFLASARADVGADGSRLSKDVQPGQPIWEHVQMWTAELDGREDEAAAYRAKFDKREGALKAQMAAMRAANEAKRRRR
jgi:hypothetical protein